MIYASGGVSLDTERMTLEWDGRLLMPTRRPFAVAELLIRRPGVVFPVGQILDHVEPRGADMSPLLAAAWVKHLRAQMRRAWGRCDWIANRHGFGYYWDARVLHRPS